MSQETRAADDTSPTVTATPEPEADDLAWETLEADEDEPQASSTLPPFTIKLVQFDADAKATSGGFTLDGMRLDWTNGSTSPEFLETVLQTLQPHVYGVYNLVTGEHYLKGFAGELTPAHEEIWALLSTDLPTAPPLAVPPTPPTEEEIQAAAEAAAAEKRRQEEEQRHQEAEAFARQIRFHTKAFNDAFGNLPSKIDPIDVEPTVQGLHIAADGIRHRRTHYPHSTPEVSVEAVEALPRKLKNLLLLVECYAHLAELAASGVDVNEQLQILNAESGRFYDVPLDA